MGLGEKIADLRQTKNMTRKELAEKAGISISYLGKIERGETGAHIKTLVRIADGLDVELNQIL